MRHASALLLALVAGTGAASAKGLSTTTYATPQEAAARTAAGAISRATRTRVRATDVSVQFVVGSKSGKIATYWVENATGWEVAQQKVMQLKSGLWKGYKSKATFDPRTQ
jgi:hypothetical protein